MPAVPAASAEPHVLVERDGSLATIVLNRPEALNALSLEMVQQIRRYLDALENDASVSCVALRGRGSRALCAGGDIRTLYDSALKADGWPEVFWAEEYALNARIASYPKAYVAFMDGIVMGGGVGVSAHGSLRLVTERTKIAMPEVGIGLLPDVGGSWLLSRHRGEIGTCLALTGMTIDASDAIIAGLADYYLPSDQLSELQHAIARLPNRGGLRIVDQMVRAFAKPRAPSRLEAHRALIDRCFSANTIEEIEERLARAGDPFATELRDTMLSKSPTSLKVTLALLRLGRQSKSLEECLTREFAAILHMTRAKADMVEGIRAAVIDKDRNPKWRPSRLEDVTDADVAAHLAEPTPPIPFHTEEART